MVAVAFLDIDGVLLPEWAYRLPQNADEVQLAGSIAAVRRERLYIHKEMAACLIHLAGMVSDLKFVLCSSWRHSFGVEPTIRWLERNGLERSYWHAYPACPWQPPSLEAAALGATSGSSKSADIAAWLDMHGSRVRRWVVLDDDEELRLRLGAQLGGEVILIDPEFGITPSDIAAAYDVLMESASDSGRA